MQQIRFLFYGRAITESGAQAELYQQALAFPPGSATYQLAERLDGKEMSEHETGTLYRTMLLDMEAGITGESTQNTAQTEETVTEETAFQSALERGILQAEQQYLKAVEQTKQAADRQLIGDIPAHASQELMDPSKLDWDARELFFWREDGTVTTSDSVTESQTVGEESAYANLLEKSFLSGLQDDTESDIILDEKQTETTDPSPKPLTEQERRAMLGTLLLDHGGMPRLEYLAAMGMDDAKARGLQSLVWLSTENDPIARRKVEAMIDSTSPEAQVKKTVQQEASTAQAPVGANVYTLNGFDGANSSAGFWMMNSDKAVDESQAKGTLNPNNGNNVTTLRDWEHNISSLSE